MNKLFLSIASLVLWAGSLGSHLALGTDVNSWPITSIGANSKLVLLRDLIIPANKNYKSLYGGRSSWAESIYDHNIDIQEILTCLLVARETSLSSRVLRAGTEIVFTGEVKEGNFSLGDDGSKRIYELQVSQPEAVERVQCQAETWYYAGAKKAENIKYKAREAKLGELIRYLRGAADLVLSEPIEIVSLDSH
jgi:hypothetical protein